MNPADTTPFRAEVSASNVYRRWLCPGGVTAERGLPELREDPAATEGTRGHWYEANPDAPRGELTTAQLRALDKNQRLTQEFLARVRTEEDIAGDAAVEVIREREYFLNDEQGDPVTPPFPGHADEVWWFAAEKVAVVLDSKFGRYAVTPAESNMQLQCYFVMVADDLGADTVYCAIRQPYLKGEDEFHSVRYTRAEHLAEARADLIGVQRLTQQEGAPRRASGEACNFCKALGTPRCPEGMVFINTLRRAKAMNLKPAELEELADEMTLARRTADYIEQRLKFVAQHYPAMLRKYELAPEQYTTEARNTVAVYRALEAEFDNDPLDFLALCKVSVPQLVKHLAQTRNVSEDDAETWLYAQASRWIDRKPKERMLVRK